MNGHNLIYRIAKISLALSCFNTTPAIGSHSLEVLTPDATLSKAYRQIIPYETGFILYENHKDTSGTGNYLRIYPSSDGTGLTIAPEKTFPTKILSAASIEKNDQTILMAVGLGNETATYPSVSLWSSNDSEEWEHLTTLMLASHLFIPQRASITQLDTVVYVLVESRFYHSGGTQFELPNPFKREVFTYNLTDQSTELLADNVFELMSSGPRLTIWRRPLLPGSLFRFSETTLTDDGLTWEEVDTPWMHLTPGNQSFQFTFHQYRTRWLGRFSFISISFSMAKHL